MGGFEEQPGIGRLAPPWKLLTKQERPSPQSCNAEHSPSHVSHGFVELHCLTDKPSVGLDVGFSVVNISVGFIDGVLVGNDDGPVDGTLVGLLVGDIDGAAVG